MEYGICSLSVIPLRSDLSDRSEMISQLLFGDLFIIMENNGKWAKVRLLDDNYEGWLDVKQISSLDETTYHELRNSKVRYTLNPVDVVQEVTTSRSFPVVMGSSIRNMDNGRFRIGNTEYEFSGNVTDPDVQPDREQLVEHALVFMNAPYLWGGKTLFGIDCSGFTQMAYKLCGIFLLRDAHEQASIGETMNLLHEAAPGDLLFFNDAEGQIIHTGIYLGDNRIIHASGKVRIDQVDHQGIFNKEKKGYTHSLRLIKKIL